MNGLAPTVTGRLAMSALLAVTTWSASAADISFSADAAVNSKYVWRGILLTDGAVLQPAVTLGGRGASANVWGNLDIDDANSMAGEFNELDYTADYTFAAGGRASASIGAVFYTFPNTAFESTAELYAGVAFDVPGKPSIRLYRDVDEVEGVYASFGLGHGVPLPGGRTLDLGLTLGLGDSDHNGFYYGSAEGGVTDVLVSVGATFDVSEAFSVAPAVAFAAALGDAGDALDAVGIDGTNAVFGVTVSCSF